MTDTLPTWGGWVPVVRDDPFGHFAHARARCPVQRVRLADGHQAWLVIGHAPPARRSTTPAFQGHGRRAGPGPDCSRAGLPGSGVRPSHARRGRRGSHPIAAAGARAFHRRGSPRSSPPSVDRRRTSRRTGRPARGKRGSVDGFAYPLPFRVIGELLGIPLERSTAAAADGSRSCFQPWSGSPPAEAVAASDSIVAYLERLVDDHRREPKDDLVGVLVTASDEYETLTSRSCCRVCSSSIVAGHDTTTSLIGNGVVALLDHPDQLRRCGGTAADARCVDELVRFSAPVPHATFRVTTEPSTSTAWRSPRGKQVLVCLGGANRDPGASGPPTSLDFARRDESNLGFGHGTHFCLGVPLARLEARVAFDRPASTPLPAPAPRRRPRRARLGARRRARPARLVRSPSPRPDH